MTHQLNQNGKVIGQAFRMCAALMLLVSTMSQAHAAEWSAPNATETKSLPPYCEARFNEKSPSREMWAQALGSSTFGSVHHYCFALNFMKRYSRTMGPERGTWLHFALDDFNYMLKNPDLRSPLVPEIYLNRAKALRLAHQGAGAISDYYKAIELGPKQPRAYSELADLFAGKAMTAQALEIVTQGLRHLPDNKALQRSYRQYGGKPPYPEPLNRPEEKPVAEPVAESSIAPPPTGVMEKGVPDSPLPTPEQAQPTQGTANNPWCRFCTE